MPKRTDIKSILIIGAGPIVIGQACEFDYSGTQACKALKAEGYRIILVNSNPATIMTDPELADATYIEPITPEIVAKIIEKERPDALLPTMGGQTALNTALALDKAGVLAKFGVEMIGAKAEAIDKAEDRQLFREAMDQHRPRHAQVACSRTTVDEAMAALEHVGLPAIIRPSFTLGGTGGGIAYNREEFAEIVERGLDASPTHQVLIEESVLGWKEFEMEVVRDKADNCIIVCSIENVDPMGVHTGDSITVAPALTLTDKEYQIMRNASIAVLREIGVETGGSNVQFAVNPDDGRLVVIEMNPRVSRSSALASKATGFPIAKVAAKLAVGYTLDELENDITGGATPASFEPTIDYVVTKIPRFAFEKFPGAERTLTTSMKSVGEVMAIGRTFAESLQKALRGLETGPHRARRHRRSRAWARATTRTSSAPRSATPTPDRLLQGGAGHAARRRSRADPRLLPASIPGSWRASRRSSTWRRASRRTGCRATAEQFRAAQGDGLLGRAARQARRARARRRCASARASRSACGRCSSASTPAPPSSPRRPPTCTRPTSAGCRRRERAASTRPSPSARDKVIILGGGPNRIGQGIEFDYCCCHACFALTQGRHRDHHGQLQPGDGLDRLRHLRPALLRAADRRGRARDHPRRAVEGPAQGRDRAVRRADAAQARRGAGGGRRADPRHLARRHRPRRGPRPLQGADRQARPQAARERHRPHARRRRAASPTSSATRC